MPSNARTHTPSMVYRGRCGVKRHGRAVGDIGRCTRALEGAGTIFRAWLFHKVQKIHLLKKKQGKDDVPCTIAHECGWGDSPGSVALRLLIYNRLAPRFDVGSAKLR